MSYCHTKKTKRSVEEELAKIAVFLREQARLAAEQAAKEAALANEAQPKPAVRSKPELLFICMSFFLTDTRTCELIGEKYVSTTGSNENECL